MYCMYVNTKHFQGLELGTISFGSVILLLERPQYTPANTNRPNFRVPATGVFTASYNTIMMCIL